MMLLLFRMFTDSCKRLRIMKSSEAIGLGETQLCAFFYYYYLLGRNPPNIYLLRQKSNYLS